MPAVISKGATLFPTRRLGHSGVFCFLVVVFWGCNCYDQTGTNATTTCVGTITTVCQPYWYENSFQNPFPGLVVRSIMYSYSECYNGYYESNGDVWAVTVRLVH